MLGHSPAAAAAEGGRVDTAPAGSPLNRKPSLRAKAAHGEALLTFTDRAGWSTVMMLNADELDTLIDRLIGVYADIAPDGVAGSDRLDSRAIG